MRRRLLMNTQKVRSTNLIVLSECGAGSLPDGTKADGITRLQTDFIKVDASLAYYHTFSRNLNDGTQEYNNKIALYDSNKEFFQVRQLTANVEHGTVLSISLQENTAYVKFNFNAKQDNPYFGESPNGI